MYAGNSITVLVVIATLALHSGCQAQTPCTDGWFGPNCQYQCHCAGSAPCDKLDGFCSSGCQQNWFGPACQYDRMVYSGPEWLTDSDDTTCNTGNTQPVTVTLDTAIPLTWVRVVVTGAGDLNQIQLNYELPASSPLQACPGLRKASVDDLTLDIECSTTEPVTAVYLFGSGISGLCSLYISGGRNVALKQRALQSSKFEPSTTNWNAGYAVDGTTGGNTPFTCTHTQLDTASPGWWTVTFSQAVDVTRFLIFNRGENRIEQT
ncbi:hypothetical protein RRG08_063665 [Elysia crispata]|uniref:Uncharacterized protein n=1 Tax=Elysia crispata TaxID=231223 RepID=A0AAE0ZUC4_9GAST|nr:hypothetical protein RRG08_063665 [Elysia crispata]